MISKAKIKYIRSLELKKNRTAEGVFVAEGPKVVGDLLATMKPRLIAATDEWLNNKTFGIGKAELGRQVSNLPLHEAGWKPALPVASLPQTNVEIIRVSEDELKRISFLQTPQQVIAVFDIPKCRPETINAGKKLALALDGVQNPGNLGTIIRIADWFGIEDIFCSHDTADAYNPKVVQATMGSIARVNIIYTELADMLSSLPADAPVYGTLLDGNDIYSSELTGNGIIVMGNEGNGISDEVRKLVNRRLLIPNFSTSADKAESLNVAIATAITCSEFRRRK